MQLRIFPRKHTEKASKMKARKIDMRILSEQDLMKTLEFRQAVLHLRNNGLNEKRAVELMIESFRKLFPHA